MNPTLASAPICDHDGNVKETGAVLRRVLDESPGSIRELAREAGVSHVLLLAVRDGQRRLTPETQEAVVAALRRWAERCEDLAESLEAAETSTPEGEGSDG